MQLRRYGAILRRRWPVILAVMLVAAVGGGALLLLGPRQYTAEVRLLITRVPNQTPGATPDFRYDDYYRFLTTEYVLDDLVEQVSGNMFALEVLERLHPRGWTALSDEQVQRALKPERTHRILTVEATGATRDEALALARAVEEVLLDEQPASQPADGSRVSMVTIHRDPVAHSNLTRQVLTFGVEMLLALLLGIGLAFLLDYLDDRVRDADDAAALGLPLLGRVPAALPRGR
jgi:capsular polysaccharide biosynthesis protein